ncbi:MAG: CPBP family intramembrane metalloprotease [Flavobacteriaceae bacterium]|nr:CPBP family intramembrane metalloprotease [Flavobacteriaceae bacterium]
MNSHFRFDILKFNWQFGLTLILLFGIPRFLLVLEANRTGSYSFTSLIFVLMLLTPFLLLKKEGRINIGLKRPGNIKWLFYSFLLGIFACVLIFFLGTYLYQSTIENWFVYISNSYGSIPADGLIGDNRLIYFVIFAVIGMTFSPIGEELLYRGLIHQSFVPEFGPNKASIIDSVAFAIVHLAHFGLVYVSGSWKILFIPAVLWMILMFLSSRLFFYCKSKTGSIFGAILCHAGFNLAMTYFIFYHIL